MANFYWVGGTGSWSEFATHWATASGGGTFHANAPTSSDDVFIDANSGFGSGGALTLDIDGGCKDFTCTSGHTYSIVGTFESHIINIYGSLTFEAGITLGEIAIEFYGSATDNTITTAGVELHSLSVQSTEAGGVWTLQDDLTITTTALLVGDFYSGNGTFNANNHNITANDFYFYSDTGYAPTVNMGSGTWEATGDDTTNGQVWYVQEVSGEVIITPETSTIKLTNTVGNTKTFIGGGKTYNNLWIAGDGNGEFWITGSNTFNDLKIDALNTVWFENGSTQTLTSFTAVGETGAGNGVYLDSTDQINQFTLSKASGVVNCDYLDISNSNAIGGATWYAGSHSADTTNNDGWIFTDEPVPVTGQFMSAGKYW